MMRREFAGRGLAPIAMVVVAACNFTASNRDGDGPPARIVGFASATSPTVDEKSATVMIPVTLSAPSDGTVTVRYSVSGGTASEGSDFDLDGQRAVGFQAGETQTSIPVRITNDMLEESSETIEIGLTQPIGAELGIATHTLTISADILPRVAFSTAITQAIEDAATKLDVSLDMTAAVEIRVDYALSGSAFAGLDYNLTAGTLVYPPGVKTLQIAVDEIDDALDEDSETVDVTLSNPVNVILGTTANTTHTIVDNDPLPVVAFAIAGHSQSEATAAATATVTLNVPSGRTVTVDYGRVGGTAGNGDVTIVPGTVTFLPGEVSHDVPITIIDDGVDEDDETAPVMLANPGNATIGAATHTLTITDDDPSPTVSFTVASQASAESTAQVTLTAQLSTTSERTITVPFAADGTSTAVSPADYSYASAAALSFPPGTPSRTITINVAGDTMDEFNETVVTALGTPTNATLGATPAHTLTINDDDALPSVSWDPAQSDGSVDEGDNNTTPFEYDVVLSAASGKTVTVPIVFTGDALSPSDYTIRFGDVPVTFTPGQTRRTVRINIVGDTQNESGSSQTVTMTIPMNGIGNATQGSPSVREHEILDDD
jgi:hypothetical protein